MNSPMEYVLRKPAEEESQKTYPVIFAMHGMGSNEQDMLSLLSGLEDHFYIFSIRGPLQQPPGFAFFTIEGFGKPHRDTFDTVIGKLTDFIDYAVDEYPIDRSRVYLLGFSQGAILAKSIGLKLGEKIRGIAALSGYIPEFVKDENSSASVKQTSLFISHGQMDPVLPFEWGLASNKYFSNLGAQVTFKEYQVAHGVSEQNYHDVREWLLDSIEKN
ncbi:alpha/beta hydrolase [Virgibacillus kekensis]|uniref:Alpha/beta hydrolase n=1 Tax=Virgibacillus kekensis TaxID=202261 RepID=A0ABV9DKJ8_9BACI